MGKRGGLGVAVLMAVLGALLPAVASAQVTNFSRDVGAAIDSGLEWIANQGGFNGAGGDASGLVALSILEKRQSLDQNAPPIGYANASPVDQNRIESIISYIINNHTGQGFYAYRDGADLMALSVYLRSGGPQQGAALNSIHTMFDRISNNQNGGGYWCYSNGGCNDSSTTQFAMAGLAAAKAVFSDPNYADGGRLARLNQMTALSAAGYRNNGRSDGLDPNERGHGYNAGNANSYQQTASGLWSQIIGGADLNDASVQGYLRWLYYRYNYQTTSAANGGWAHSYFYYLWSSAKAYSFLEDSGVVPAPGNIDTDAIGTLHFGNGPPFGARQQHLDPAGVARAPRWGGEGPGYYASPFEPARWYFDYAYTLITNQDGNGYFVNTPGNANWVTWDAQCYSLLVLERSVGGGCVESDQDAICDFEDNCPAIPNPDQSDDDGDGVGDPCDNCMGVANPDQGDNDRDGIGNACDNCPDLNNPDQRDIDHDDIGDACDPVICMPSGPEVCDGIDNDCDGNADEDGIGEDEACDTGLIGQCGVGLTDCRGGAIVCVQQHFPEAEVCNGLDDDCDGAVDNGDPGGGEACNTGVPGECEEGIGVCLNGAVHCISQRDPRGEICNGRDDDCDGEVDEDNPEAGQACDTGNLGVCADGVTDCRSPRLICVQLNAPGLEICDGLDNDCDGQADEDDPEGGAACQSGLGGQCANGVNHCLDGRVECVPDRQPAPELCNGLDDDCDDVVDNGNPEGDQRCDTGRRGVCADGRTVCANGAVQCEPLGMPGPEICDFLDNDCNGETDEGLGIGNPCQTDLPGTCTAGSLACDGGAVVCAPLSPPVPEVCDGLDNDCNALVDDIAEGAGDVCGTGRVGECARGVMACEGGVSVCTQNQEPSDERCNHLDDDCDGVIDEDLRNACGTCGDAPEESCNGDDDDCDGQIDEDAPCPQGQVCAYGHCVDRCFNNECSGALLCEDGVCVSACDLAQCADDLVCRDGECLDPCADMQCGEGQACAGGECVADNCYEAGCAEGQRCVDFICEDDPCAAIFCNEGEFCRDGACVPSCATVSCAFGQGCRDGACVPDPCADVECADGQACIEGQCGGDPCEGITCAAGQRCENGLCGHDGCFGVVCPPAERCEVRDGNAQCIAAWPPLDEPGFTPDAGIAPPDAGPTVQDAIVATDLEVVEAPEAGPDATRSLSNTPEEAESVAGCGCRTPGRSAPAALWLLLPLLGAPALRRRRR